MFPHFCTADKGSSQQQQQVYQARDQDKRPVDDTDPALLRAQRRTRTRASSTASSWTVHTTSPEENRTVSSREDPEILAHQYSNVATTGRDRSHSRTSVATADSGSTIRPSGDQSIAVALPAGLSTSLEIRENRPRRDALQSGHSSIVTNDRRAYLSETQSSKDRRRTRDVLKRRLVDSAITIELPDSEATAMSRFEAVLSGRKRGLSAASDATSTTTPRTAFTRSESSSVISLKSGLPLVRPSRSRTLSTPVHIHPQRTPSSRSQPAAASGDTFFVSDVCHDCLNPTFDIEPRHFVIDQTNGDLFDDSYVQGWSGMRESRIVVKVWARSGCIGRSSGQEEDWRLLTEWDIALDGLVSLGRDALAVPDLPPNTLMITMGDEYFTAASATRSRHRRARSGMLPLPVSRRTFAALSDHSSDSSDSSDSAQDGNLSDPGARFGHTGKVYGSKRRKRKLERRKLYQLDEEQRRRRALVERSLRETRMVKAASAESVHRLIMLEHTGRELAATSAEIRKRLDEAVSGKDNTGQLVREAGELKDRVDDLQDVQADLKLDLEEEHNALQQRRKELEARRTRLNMAGKALEHKRRQLRSADAEIVKSELVCLDTKSAAHDRRIQIITLLSQMFPIDPVDTLPPSLAAVSNHLLFCINGLALPNSTYPASFPDEILSSALGYTAQVVSLLSTYLSVPLNYPIKCLGSRSAVIDPISMMKGPRAFPLYGKNVDKYRFDYGVFLLNKDIEQLMYSQKLTVIDLRNTLPNLKSLVLSLSLDPSHVSFSSSALVIPPSYFAETNDGTHLTTSDDYQARSTTLHVVPSPRSTSPELTNETGASDGHTSPVSTVKGSSIRSNSPASTVRANGTDSTRSSRSNSVSQKETAQVNGNGSASDEGNSVKAGKGNELGLEVKDKLRSTSGSRFSLWNAVGYGTSGGQDTK
ncbi:hypothetical protein OIV83_003257 [Microbotryomycetes sp. JL201]|nr:hypothetical protein OIV83_003257 [Microbotryomycetes sp. JL201]